MAFEAILHEQVGTLMRVFEAITSFASGGSNHTLVRFISLFFTHVKVFFFYVFGLVHAFSSIINFSDLTS